MGSWARCAAAAVRVRAAAQVCPGVGAAVRRGVGEGERDREGWAGGSRLGVLPCSSCKKVT